MTDAESDEIAAQNWACVPSGWNPGSWRERIERLIEARTEKTRPEAVAIWRRAVVLLQEREAST